VIVNTKVPEGEPFLVLTVSTEFPEFTTKAGLNLGVAFFGSPLSDSVTVPEKPGPAVMEIV
jgi:hypothetical protein